MAPKWEPVNEEYLVGYARVSTEEQRLDLQIDALRAAGVREDNLHVEKVSGASSRRPALELAIKDLRPGDVFVVWRLDRLARNVRDLYRRLDEINEAGAGFRSLTEHFDFGTATGNLIIGILASVAEFERQIIAQRTAAGMQAAKDRGAKMGAATKFTAAKQTSCLAMLRAGKKVPAVARALKISKASIYAKFKVKRNGGKVLITRRP